MATSFRPPSNAAPTGPKALLPTSTPHDMQQADSAHAKLDSLLGGHRLHLDAHVALLHFIRAQEIEINRLKRHAEGLSILAPSAPAASAQAYAKRGQLIQQHEQRIRGLNEELAKVNAEKDGLRYALDVLREGREERDESRKREKQSKRHAFDRLLEQEKRIKQQLLRIKELEMAAEEQETAIVLATAFQKQVHEDRESLRNALGREDHLIEELQRMLKIANDERETMRQSLIEKHEKATALEMQLHMMSEQFALLNEQKNAADFKLLGILNAENWDDAMAEVLKVQAQTSLDLIKHLRADLAEKENGMQELKTELVSVRKSLEDVRSQLNQREAVDAFAQIESEDDALLAGIKGLRGSYKSCKNNDQNLEAQLTDNLKENQYLGDSKVDIVEKFEERI